MISFQASCIRSRYNVLPKTWVFPRPINVFSRSSSLSAIHRGLRNSEKARPQGFKKEALNTSKSNRREKQTFTIKKGKKNITGKGQEPKSRAARFHDPNDPFGKKSLVYQLKNGRNDPSKEKSAFGSRDAGISKDQFMRDFHHSGSSPSMGSKGPRGSMGSMGSRGSTRSIEPRRSAGSMGSMGPPKSMERTHFTERPSFQKPSNESRPWDRRGSQKDRKSPVSNRNTRDTWGARDTRDTRSTWGARDDSRGTRSTWGAREDTRGTREDTRGTRDTRGTWGTRDTQDMRETRRAGPYFQRASPASEPSPRRQRDEEDQRPAPRASPLKDAPIRIPRTTAASQFLYGYSVVEAALKQTRRKLYNLYIYDGENRQDASRNTGMERKAALAGIPVTKLTDAAGLRMMEKMSDGRPHNGFVLEASPLPQLPIKGLGSLVEDPTTGFNVELGHQSAEEAQINGTSTFVKYTLPPNRKPFVLILDGILDPGNLGAILRSAAFLGVNAVGITQGHSAPLTSVAVKASAGASEILQLFSISSILDFLSKSREAGWVVYAAVAPTDRPREGKNITLDKLDTYDPMSSEPTILVVGSEGEGLDKKTRRMADFEISIPNQSGTMMVDSLNASVATAILCSAFLKNQHTGGIFDKVIEVKGDVSDSLW
ncbi:uncharacterized protein F4812DRAFT_427702 [Daldinia caldariorum]|uniref:uncharacterized protein n=1 Tax=Daldinia caldariorum TaxID=326644 RepID=UPI002007C94E|nr:uncharacterized protein F4812DRAFT_427702 [Daldinia caldariorum]KAI1467823.1 hypothetical protein F4812DRAFT_427702 [Daldinia caldariorum]